MEKHVSHVGIASSPLPVVKPGAASSGECPTVWLADSRFAHILCRVVSRKKQRKQALVDAARERSDALARAGAAFGRTPDEEWLHRLVDAARAFDVGELAADGDAPLYDGPTEVAARITWLCQNLHRHRAGYGDEKLGRALWYLMGVGRQAWMDVHRAPPEAGVAAVRSLSVLYREVFATLPFPADGSRDTEGWLEGAGYMLWDMDGGLCLLPSGRVPHLTAAALDVLSGALALDAPLCWYSALHGLGHNARGGKNARVVALIDGFVAARRGRLTPFFERYAAAARVGYVQ